MPDENVHAIALQIAQASQRYEQYMTEIEAVHTRYQGTLQWVESLLGESTDDIQAMFGEVTENKDAYKRSVLRCRNTLLRISQALLRLGDAR